MERGHVHACHAGALVHALEGWEFNEVGPGGYCSPRNSPHPEPLISLVGNAPYDAASNICQALQHGGCDRSH